MELSFVKSSFSSPNKDKYLTWNVHNVSASGAVFDGVDLAAAQAPDNNSIARVASNSSALVGLKHQEAAKNELNSTKMVTLVPLSIHI